MIEQLELDFEHEPEQACPGEACPGEGRGPGGTTLLVELKKLVDKYSLGVILDTLGSVCYEKSDHIRSDWKDDHLARLWETKGRVMQSMAAGENILEIYFKDYDPAKA